MKLFIISLALFCVLIGGIFAVNIGSIVSLTKDLSQRKKLTQEMAEALRAESPQESVSDKKSLSYAFNEILEKDKAPTRTPSGAKALEQKDIQVEPLALAQKYLQEMEADPSNKLQILQRALSDLSRLSQAGAGKVLLLEQALKMQEQKQELAQIAMRELREPLRKENRDLSLSDLDMVRDADAIQKEADQNAERTAMYLAQSLLFETTTSDGQALVATTVEGISFQNQDKNLQELMFHQFVTRFPEQKENLQQELRKVNISLD